MLGKIAIGYLVAGVLAGTAEEMYVIKNADKMFKFNPLYDGTKFLDRFKGYNLKKFEVDVKDILSWPYGFVCWRRGIKRFKNMSEEEIKEAIVKYKEKYEKEGLM